MTASHLAALDFSSDIDQLIQDFTGREWLFEEIEHWLHHQTERFLLLTGEPGVGKSAIAARLTQIRPDNLAAYHFCLASKNRTVIPSTTLRSLAAQLGHCRWLPQYGEALANTVKELQVIINVNVNVETMTGGEITGVVINQVAPSDPERELEIFLGGPLAKLPTPSNPLFILIDSLDEAVTYRESVNLVTLLAKVEDLPPWVRFLCTSRPEQTVLSHFKRFEPYTLATESQMNLADIYRYIEYRVSNEKMQPRLQTVNVAPQILASRVAELADGNFLYTKVLLNDIEGGQQSLDDLNTLPQSLDDIYHGFLRRFSDNDWDERYQPILGKLAVVQEPITEEQLANFTGLGRRQVRRSLGVVGQYLNITKDNQGNETYRLFHQSLRDYLLDEDRSDLFWCNPEEEHETIADYYLKEYGDDWEKYDTYGLNHLSLHLVEAGRGATLVKIVKDLNYLAVKTHVLNAYTAELDLTSAEAQASDDDVLPLLHRQFALAGHLLNQCEQLNNLRSTLHARLQHLKDLQPLTDQLVDSLTPPYLTLWHPLPDLPHPALLRTFAGHRGPVYSCAISTDGAFIVSASADNTLKVWDAQTGIERFPLHGHTAWVSDCVISPDSSFIVSASGDGTLKIWDARTGAEHLTLQGHKKAVNSCAISADGSFIVSASADYTLKVWDSRTGVERMTLKDPSWVSCCAISTDGSVICSVSWDFNVKLWDAQTGTLQGILQGSTGVINCCAISPEGSFVVFAQDDNTLQICDTQDGVGRLILQGHTAWVQHCIFSNDGRFIVSASDDNTLKLWDVKTGTELMNLIGHAAPVKACTMSNDGLFIVSASEDGTIKVWNALPKDKFLPQGHSAPVYRCATTTDGTRVISASEDHTLKIWDALSGFELLTLRGHTGSVFGCAVSSDRSFVVSASIDDTLKVWDIETGVEHMTLRGHADWVQNCAISSDGSFIVSASKDNTLKLWKVKAGSERMTLRGHTDRAMDCAISTDGTFIVSASLDKTLKVWNVESGTEHMTLRGHEDTVIGCAISGDLSFIASCSDDQTLKIWDIETGTERMTLRGHNSRVGGCAISPDNFFVVSASKDQTLKVWDIRTGKCVATLFVDGTLFHCTWAPDGQHIVAVGTRGVYFLRFVR